MTFVGKKRMYDVIGSVIATLVATLVINNFKSVLSFFNLEFQINLSVGLIAAVTISFISVVVTVSLLKKRHNLELNMKGEQIKALRIKMLELEDISSKDSLTNTYNSNQVHRILGERIEKAKEKKQPFVGLLIDIDCFKKVNEITDTLRETMF